MGALSHLRVLDLSRVLAGPFTTQNLADLGAEVIKIERPGEGDETRGWGPPFIHALDGTRVNAAGYFLSVNRNKKSVTVDLSRPEGQDVIRRLAAISDVVIENYKVGTLARYGLSYADLSAVNPRLVYCSITGFGQTGPYAALPGYDFVFQGMSGLMSITGQPDGAPGGGPVKVGTAIADLVTGLYAATAILAALAQREQTGRGQHIDLSLLDGIVSMNSFQALNYFLGGATPRRLGNAHPNMVPYSVFACADGHIILAVGNDSQFARFCALVGRADLAADPRFATVAQRLVNREALIPTVEAIMLTRTKAQWMADLGAANVPCGPINTIPEVFEDPQIQHRGMRIDMVHGSGTAFHALGNPMRLSDSPPRYETPPPALGEHTEAVLRDLLGLGEAEIAALRAAEAI